MSLIDQIRMAQRDAGEAAVMADLKRKGLLIEEPKANSRKDAEPFGYLLTGPQGLFSFSRASDCTKPVIELHEKTVAANPEYQFIRVYTHPPEADKLPPDVKAAIEMCLAHYGNDPRVEPLRTFQEGKKCQS